jgi:hypothetical protein
VFEKMGRFLKSEGIVEPRFSYLKTFAVKFLELVGAGLASAIVAYLLAHIGTPPTSSLPLVQVTAANAEMMRMVRDEHALLVELGKELDVQRKPEQLAATPMPVPAPRSAKPAQGAPLRNHKADAKQLMGEPLPIEPALAVSHALPKAMAPSPKIMELSPAALPIHVSASTNAEGEWASLGMLKRISGWFLPENGDVPRPPMPVGEFTQSAM